VLDTDLPCDARAEKVEPAAAPRNTVRRTRAQRVLEMDLFARARTEQVEPVEMERQAECLKIFSIFHHVKMKVEYCLNQNKFRKYCSEIFHLF
jgi:hypothetical protein